MRMRRLNLATSALLALLERSPAVRISAEAAEFVVSLPSGCVLRSAAFAAVSLGLIDSVAGATLLASTLNPDPTGPLPPLVLSVGAPITPVGFTIANLLTIGSWKVTGVVPPGLTLTTVQPNGGSLTGLGGGVLDATTATNTITTPLLEGTPTAAGTYTLNFQGFWYPNESGGPFGGKGVSSVFPFTINVSGSPPAFTTQPISVSVASGTVALDALATNGASYQWMRNGAPVAGATDSTLLIPDAAQGVGAYTCVASNGVGSATSDPATVTVSPTGDVGRLINISTRSQVGTGANILIAGFTVGGQGTSGTEPMLIRGSGPALTPLGVGGALPDPELQLFLGSSLQAENKGWNGDAAVSAGAVAVGAFKWGNPSSHDSALLVSKPAGGYTAQVSGESGDTGVALVEVYDATPAGAYVPSSPRLINISARVQVGTGGDILIAGFVIGGSTAKTVLIRASGPALVQFAVDGRLPDPQLTLLSGSTILASNSAWGGAKAIADAGATVGAFGWPVPSSNDSALLITLPPGPYTAQVSGASGDTGVALVELYEVP